MQQLQLEFRGEGAAGWGSPHNPQFFLNVTCPGAKAAITVKCATSDALCFFVQKVEGGAHRKRIFDFGAGEDAPGRIHTSSFVAAKEHTEEVVFRDPGPYVCLVMTNEAGVEGPVSLEVSGTPCHVEISGGADYKPEKAAFKFGPESSFGSPKNPQLLLHVHERCNLGITMTVEGASAVCFYVQQSPEQRRLLAFPDTAPDRVFTSKYSSGAEVAGSIPGAPGSYVILCSQQEKGKELAGVLSVESDTPNSFSLEALAAAGGRKKTLQFNKDCGGYGSARNPQFFLSLTNACNVAIEMSCAEKAVDAIRFFVQKMPGDVGADGGGGGFRRLTEFPEEKSNGRAFTSRYVSAQSVSETMPSLAAGAYVFLAMTRSVCATDVTLSVEADDDPSFQLDGKNLVLPHATGHPSAFGAQLLSRPQTAVDVKGTVCNQVYETWEDAKAVVDAINAEHNKNPQLYFVDPDMPHTEHSINGPGGMPIPAAKGAVWQRLSYFAPEDPQLFVNDDETNAEKADDVCQGACSDCWLVAVCASIATRTDITSSLFYPNETSSSSSSGAFAVKIITNGKARGIIIDDSLPENPSKPAKLLFGHSSTPNEFWFALLEKALAKFCGGSYNYLAGGYSARGLGIVQALEMLSGGVGRYVNFNADGWFAEVSEALGKNWLATTQTIEAPGGGGGGGPGEGLISKTTGLVYMHAYSIINAKIATGSGGETFRLLQLRNTWNKGGEWTGAWSDSSPLWTQHPSVAAICEMQQQRAGSGQLTRKAAADDGVFWIDDSSFMQNFTTINVLNLLSDELPHKQHIDVAEMSISAEGHNLLPYEQFIVSVDQPGALVDIRIVFIKRCKSSMRLVLVSSSGAASSLPVFLETKVGSVDGSGSKKVLEVSKYAYDNCTVSHQLGDDESSIIVCPQLHPTQKHLAEGVSGFRVIVHSSSPISALRQLPAAKRASVQHGWLTPASFQSDGNPRVKILLRQSTSISLQLVAENPEDKQGMKMVLAKVAGDDGGGGGALWRWPNDNFVAETKYLSTATLELSVPRSLGAGEYVLWATLQRPTKRGFTLMCMSQVEVEMSPVAQDDDGMGHALVSQISL